MTIDRLQAGLGDRYTIERQLGQGGMATVYLAQDLKHDRKVALKVLRPELAAVLGADRFVQEIKTTAALQHPHILPLFDSGTVGDSGGRTEFLYYVMPYVQGETLRDKLNRETQLSVEEAVKITTEVADALDYAHRQGVIHRDIKPENILLHDGRPMVADFGIALAVSAAAGGRLTETGLSLGTPHYMSPEQATADKDLTNRSDVYSLGSVLYEMLTGNPPHTGASAQQIIMKIVTEVAPPVTLARRSVPPNVAAAVAKAIEKLPADRFDSAKAFAEALANPAFQAATIGVAGAAPTFTARRSPLVAGLGVLAGLFAVLALWGWLRPSPRPPVSRYGLAFAPGQEPVGRADAPTPAPDGSFLVYQGKEGSSSTQLWLKRRDRYEATPIPGTTGAESFAISPDGAWIAFVAGNQLKKIPLTGGTPVLLVDGRVISLGVAWLDDGTIAFTRDTSGTPALARVAAQGGGASIIWRSQGAAGMAPAAIPGKRGLLFTRCTSTRDCGIWALDLKTDSARMVTATGTGAQYAKPGHVLFVLDGGLMVVPFDPDRLVIRGSPIPLTDSVGGGLFPFRLSASGTLVERMGLGSFLEAAVPSFQMVWVNRQGQQTPVDTSWSFRMTAIGNNTGWALSPDGSRVAIGLNTQDGDDIWIKQMPRGPLSRLTSDPGSDFRPHWTPDGRYVTFVRIGARSGLLMHRADGTGTDSVLLRFPPLTTVEALRSPDGRWLLYRQGLQLGPGGRDIYGVRAGSDTTPVPLVVSRFDEEAFTISPDGRWLAYQSDETGKTEVYIRPFPETSSGKQQISSGGGTAPLWSRDGRELYFLGADRRMMAVRVGAGPALSLGAPVALFRVPDELLHTESDYYTPWDVAADGRFLMARATGNTSTAGPPIVVVENFLDELRLKTGK